jgi:polysaccharide export outer membrane protein
MWVVLSSYLVCAGCSAEHEFTATEGFGPAIRMEQGSPYGGPPTLGSGIGAVAPPGAVIPAVALTPEEPPPMRSAGPPVALAEHGGPAIPRELEKVSHPPYVIEPPDVLIVDAVRLIPRPPYRVEPLDALAILVTNALPKEPIEGIYSVDPSGAVDLGFTYGSVPLYGKTLKEAKQVIEEHLKLKLKPPFEVYVSLAESRVMQQVRGEHLVRQDGTIGLGTYGAAYVTGMTIPQAKAAIEAHLSQFLFEPKISLDVAGFNSHVYFVIFDFPGGGGQQIYRKAITGNETVLDALGEGLGGLRAGGLPPGVSKRRIWVARPAPAKSGRCQILPVDWAAITRNADPTTNYQLLPGDRLYVAQDPCVALDLTLARFFAPFERVFGITLLGNSVYQSLTNPTNTFGGGTR